MPSVWYAIAWAMCYATNLRQRLCIVAMSILNHAYEDRLIKLDAQTLIDFVIVILGATLFLKLVRIHPESDVGKVLQFVAGTLLLL